MFLSRHVFVNVALGAMYVPSGTDTSATNCAQLQFENATGRVKDEAEAGKKERISPRIKIVEARVKRCFIRAS